MRRAITGIPAGHSRSKDPALAVALSQPRGAAGPSIRARRRSITDNDPDGDGALDHGRVAKRLSPPVYLDFHARARFPEGAVAANSETTVVFKAWIVT